MNKLNEYLLYLFFAIFPFYTAIRIYNIPLALIILSLLYGSLLLKIFYRKKILLPKIFLSGLLLISVFFILGKLFYGRVGIKDILPFIWGTIPLLLLNLYDNRGVFEKSLKILFYSTSFLSFMIFFQFLGMLKLSFIKIHTHKSGLKRLLGIGSDPNPNSFVLLFFIVFVLSVFLFKKNKIMKNVFYLILVFPILIVIILSESRSILFGFIISLILVFIIFLIKTRGKISKYPFYIIGVIGILTLLFSIIKPNKLVFSRFASTEFSQRTIRWKAAVDIWLSSPFVGVGFENIKNITAIKTGIKAKNVHNAYLESLAGTGIIGFGAFLLFILIVYTLLYNFSISSNNYYIYFIIITTFFLFNLAHSMLFINSFWIALGFLETDYYLQTRRPNVT